MFWWSTSAPAGATVFLKDSVLISGGELLGADRGQWWRRGRGLLCRNDRRRLQENPTMLGWK